METVIIIISIIIVINYTRHIVVCQSFSDYFQCLIIVGDKKDHKIFIELLIILLLKT